jgi:hypothetical protein
MPYHLRRATACSHRRHRRTAHLALLGRSYHILGSACALLAGVRFTGREGAFCGEQGLSEQSFYWWKRTIAERDLRAGTPAFVPVRVAPAAAGPALEVVAGPGRVVRVPAGFDANALRRLLAVLEEGPSC